MDLFKEYDIRGDAKFIDQKFTLKLAKALVKYFVKGKIVIGWDARLSSPEIGKQLRQFLSNHGFTVIDIGLSSTPYFYHCVMKGEAEGGVMVTASHLPKEQNGFKIVGKNSVMVAMNSGLELIKKYFETNYKLKPTKGSVIEGDYLESYKEIFGKEIFNYKILIDCSSGTGLIEANMLSEHFKSVKIINDSQDLEHGTHSPNPLEPAARNQAKKLVTNYDFAAIFDADEDRVVFLDELGNYHNPDVIGMIISKNYPSVVRDITCTRLFGQKKTVIITKVGRSNVHKAMILHKAPFGFEKSGHYYFQSFNYLDNGALAILEIAKILKETNKKFSELILDHKPFYTDIITIPNQNVDLAVIEKNFSIIGKCNINYVDGLTLEGKNWFINLRKSNTENITRVTFESRTLKQFNMIKKLIGSIRY